MYKIQTLNKISPCGLKLFDSSRYSVSDTQENPDAIVLRSFSMHEMELPESLLAVARAGAGVNNIPIDKCSKRGIVVFNTPGANANAVKELAIAGLFLSSRKIVDGITWAWSLKGESDIPKLVEKGKSAFEGPEIEGKTLAVIGLGAIGVMVANAAYYLGMDVIGYDPYISVKSALGLSRHVNVTKDLKTAIECADYVTIHAPLTDETRGMFNESTIKGMKDGARLLNFSRAELVNNEDVAKALESGKISCYVTDFPNAEVLDMKNVIPIPHLGASTPESENNCAVMAAKEVIDYLENGNITNSVNFPSCEMPREEGGTRITIAHMNIPNMLGQFSTLLAAEGANIDNMVNKSKSEYAYTMIDLKSNFSDEVLDKIKAIDGVLLVRVIK